MTSLMTKAMTRLSRSNADEHDGQALVEYSLIIVLIIIVCITILSTTGDVVRDELWGMTSQLPFWNNDGGGSGT